MADVDPDQPSPFTLLHMDCISKVISLTNSPEDACTLSAVSKGFQSAAESDALWEGFLPSDYQMMLSGSVTPVIYSSKKELYMRLCDSPLLLEEGNLSFWLSKRTGKKCYMLSARRLIITWSDTPRYWQWKSIPESRFSKVVLLKEVCWLHIFGTLTSQMLSPETNYTAYLVFKLTEHHSGLDIPAKAACGISDGLSEIYNDHAENVYLVPPRAGTVDHVDCRVPENRTDGWMEIKLGKFFNPVEENMEISFGLQEKELLDWKRGFIVEGIEVRPTSI